MANNSNRIGALESGSEVNILHGAESYVVISCVESCVLCLFVKIDVERIQWRNKTMWRKLYSVHCAMLRYLAEAHFQAMQFDEAQKLSKQTLEIHRAHSAPASLEEAADCRLMALICEAKDDHEAALEHLVLASMVMIANGQENEVAAIDVGIGNIYLSLCRFDEAVFSYQKALTVFKSSKGENHPLVASVYIRLADLYYKTGKLRESKSYCENALRIYNKPVPGTTQEDIGSGLSEIAVVYESINEPEEALKLLAKAMRFLEDKAGQQSTYNCWNRSTHGRYVLCNWEICKCSNKNAVHAIKIPLGSTVILQLLMMLWEGYYYL